MAGRPLRKRRGKPRGIMSLSSWRGLAQNRVVYWILAIATGVGIVAMFSAVPSFKGGANSPSSNNSEVVCVVNGEDVTRSQYDDLWNAARQSQSYTDANSALPQGQVLQSLVSLAILRAEAKKLGITVTDSDIDNAIQKLRVTQGSKSQPLSDDEVMQLTGEPSMDQVREHFRLVLLPTLLGATLAKTSNLTYADLAASYDEINVRRILIAVTGSPVPFKNALPDAQARQRADMIMAKLKAGGNFAALANEYTSDPTNSAPSFVGGKSVTKPKGGELGWYKRGGGQGQAFDTAAFALAPSQLAGPIKTPEGYQIIQVEQKRTQLPPDYEKNKAALLDQYRQQKAGDAVEKLVAKDLPTANIGWKDPDLQWRYLYAKDYYASMYSMPGSPATANQAQLVSLLQKVVKTDRNDSSAAFVLGNMLYQQYMTAGITEAMNKRTHSKTAKAPDRAALRNQAIAAFETALIHGEDRNARFELAQLYQDAKENGKAVGEYQEIMKLLQWDASSSAKDAYQRLATAFRQLGKADLAAEAEKHYAVLEAKDQQAKAEQAKQAAQQAAERKARDIEAKLWMEKHQKEQQAQKAGKPGAPAPTAPVPSAAGKPAPGASAPAPASH